MACIALQYKLWVLTSLKASFQQKTWAEESTIRVQKQVRLLSNDIKAV